MMFDGVEHEKSFNITLLLLLLILAAVGKQLYELMINSASHLEHNGIAAKLRNDHIDFIDHLAPFMPEVSIYRH